MPLPTSAAATAAATPLALLLAAAERLELVDQLQEQPHAHPRDDAGVDGGPHRATRLLAVGAVAEATLRTELDQQRAALDGVAAERDRLESSLALAEVKNEELRAARVSAETSTAQLRTSLDEANARRQALESETATSW